MATSRPARVLIGVVLTVALLGSCASGDETTIGDTSPTFRRIADEALRYSEPRAITTDLLRPQEEGDPWRIVGSVLDPDSRRSHAAVWTAADGRRWERADIDTAGGEASESMAAVTPFDGTALAVGRRDDGQQSDAVVWRAGDDNWDAVAPEEMGGMHDQWTFDVAASDRGVLVAGGENAWGEVRARLWFSPDGETWETVDGGPGGPFDTTGEESVQAITAVGEGFVAVGWGDVDGQRDALAWYSSDGRSWEPVDAPTLGGDGRQSAQSVTMVGSMVVAGGFLTGGDGGQGAPVVWRSPDGQSWSGPTILPLHDQDRADTDDMTVRSLSVADDQLLAAGGTSWRPHLWRSGDQGATWQLLPNPVRGQQFQDGIALEDVAAAGDLTLGLGSEPTVIELSGERWADATGQEFPTGGSKPAATTVLMQDSTLLVGGVRQVSRLEDAQRRRDGGSEGEGQAEGQAAEGEPPAEGQQPQQPPPSPPPGDPAQSPRDRYNGNLWLQDGGGGLDEVRAEGDAEFLNVGTITDVAAIANGYVAVGFESFAVASERSLEDGKPDGLLWTSEDGRRWVRAAARMQNPDPELVAMVEGDPTQLSAAAIEEAAAQPWISEDPAGGPGTRSLRAVASINDGYIAVGETFRDLDGNPNTSDYDTDPLVLISPDGTTVRGEPTGLQGPGTQLYRDVCVKEGVAVVVGATESDGGTDVAVNVRDRNRAWHAATATDDSFGGGGRQQALACAASEDGFIMVGTDNSRGNVDARVWTSADGMEWEMVPASALGGNGDQIAMAVAPVPDSDGWLIGGNDTAAGDSDIALWRLGPDGEISRRDRGEPSLGGPGPQILTGLATNGRRTVVVGQDHTGAGVWETYRLDR